MKYPWKIGDYKRTKHVRCRGCGGWVGGVKLPTCSCPEDAQGERLVKLIITTIDDNPWYFVQKAFAHPDGLEEGSK